MVLCRTTVRYRRIRREILALLGDECKRCGFHDLRALQVDHINGGGRKDMGWGGITYWTRVRNEVKAAFDRGERSTKYQLLCANCNWIKRCERREHPRSKLDAALSASVH